MSSTQPSPYSRNSDGGNNTIRTHQADCFICCENCGAKFKNKKQLRSHSRRHSRYACKFKNCNSIYASYNGLKTHMRIHADKTPSVCNICKNVLTSKDALLKHMKSHIGDKPYHCHICENSYGKCDDLANHLNEHRDETAFTCKICPKRFVRSNLFLEHVALHVSESAASGTPIASHQEHQKSYVCIYCNKSYEKLHYLRRHLGAV